MSETFCESLNKTGWGISNAPMTDKQLDEIWQRFVVTEADVWPWTEHHDINANEAQRKVLPLFRDIEALFAEICRLRAKEQTP